ncbi:MAG: RagB/SusD family nutrient uptake outer membrane protein [Bacteroidota bacterium]
MNNLNIFILLFIFGLAATSCDSFLDLEPETSLSSAVAFDNIEGIEAGINGVYSTLHSDWVERQYLFSETLASNVKEVNVLSNANYQATLRHEAWTDLFNTGNYLWSLSFKAVDELNQILQALPNIEQVNGQVGADVRRLQGEALFLRGLTYFVLNRFYGQPQNGLSVPLVKDPFVPGDMPVRATIDETKAQVVSDLQEAEILMDGIENNNGRATIWAVRALLARVYFEYKDYTNAETYADLVIESGKFNLLDGNVTAAFSTNISTENIFTFLSLPNDRAANLLFDRFSLNNANVQLSVSDDYWALISKELNDLRVSVLHEDLGVGVACNKYDDRDMNIPYIRLPEMYLIRAEASVENGNLDAGLADLNRLRQRAELAPTSYSDKSDLLEKIYVDRCLELSMEGDNFHNLKRLERPIGGYSWEEARYKLVFFIPEKEVQLNTNLVQNDTW